MLTPRNTHKSYKITSLTTDSYKQLFVLITMLLTVLSVQQSTFTMAAPLEKQQPIPQQQQPPLIYNHPSHHTQLHDILLAETNGYDHHRYRHHHHAEQQLETDLAMSEERLQKRHISWHDYFETIMQSQRINWYNPCGGIPKMDEIPVKRKRPPPIKKELKRLQNTIAKNYKSIKVSLQAIDIRKMSQWQSREKDYSFLPKLNVNSSISLRRWHRQMQIYVAAFEYLRRAQLYFDNLKSSLESDFSHELNDLMDDARGILCNIEHAINNTTTRKGKSEIDALFTNRTTMEKILIFQTDIKHVSPLHWHQVKDVQTRYLVNVLDLKFVKSHYYSFIRKLIKILRTHTRQRGPIYLGKKGRPIKAVTDEAKTKKLPLTRHSKRKLN